MKRTFAMFVLCMAVLSSWAVAPSRADTAAGSGDVPHGRDVTPERTGPEALGRISGRRVEGGVITDTVRPAYVQHIDGPAAYHGVGIATPHLLIADVEIRGALDISATLPLVMFRTIVTAGDEAEWLVMTRPGAGPLHVLWSDIGGAGRRRSASPHVTVALALRADGARVHRSRVGAAADGIQIGARDIAVTESLIDGLLARAGDHNDAIQLFASARSVTIARNRIRNRHPQTSAITVLGEAIEITGNWLSGGGWTLYGGARGNGNAVAPARGVRVTGNVFSREVYPGAGKFGPVTYWERSDSKDNVWRGNIDDRGRPIDPPR